MLCCLSGVVMFAESRSMTPTAELEKEFLNREKDEQNYWKCLNTKQEYDTVDLDFRTQQGE